MPGEVFKHVETKEFTLSDGSGAGFVKVDSNGVMSGGNDLSAIGSDIIPSIDDNFSLGSLIKQWKTIFVLTALLTSLVIGGLVKLSEVDGILFVNASTKINGSLEVLGNITVQNITAEFYFGDISQATGGGGGGSSPWNSSGSDVYLNDSSSSIRNISLTGQLTLEDGSATNPSIHFSGDPDSGIFRASASGISTTHGGTERVRLGFGNGIKIDFGGTCGIPGYSWIGDPNTGISQPAGDDLRLCAGGVEFIRMDEGGDDFLIFNDAGINMDFKVETNNEENMLFIDGGNDKICIGCNVPNSTLQVNGIIDAVNVFVPKYLSVHTPVNMSLTQNEWRNVTFPDEGEIKKGIAHQPIGRLNTTINITAAGIYDISYEGTFIDSAVGGGSEIAVRVTANGTEIIGSLVEITSPKQNAEFEITDRFLANLTAPSSVHVEVITNAATVSLQSEDLFGVHPSTMIFDMIKIDKQ